VVHIHSAAFETARVSAATAACPSALVVSTPVFGRPPEDLDTLRQTKVCCVGTYTFYRLCRWLRVRPQAAIERGIGFVPLTPLFLPPQAPTRDDARQTLGIPLRAFVVGRVGRETPSKWHADTEESVSRLLSALPEAVWISVGHPEARGMERLLTRWGSRFIALGETSDEVHLATAFRAMDVQLFHSPSGECFAATICEAAGNGVPTVAVANALKDNGQAEQVRDGVTGMLVRDAAHATREIIRLARDEPRVRALQSSALRHAHERWASARVANDLADLYRWWGSGGTRPSYADTMLREATEFHFRYRAQMSALHGPRALSAWWAAGALRAAEYWPTFKAGRLAKRVYGAIRNREPLMMALRGQAQ
jgi:glycosyltransferase involved in cell wall biosynthesis